MEIAALEGMDLVSLAWDGIRFDLTAVDSDGSVFQLFLSNPDQKPIEVVIHWANFHSVHDEGLGLFTLGEIETITVNSTGVHIEADAGHFSVKAAKHFVQRLSMHHACDA